MGRGGSLRPEGRKVNSVSSQRVWWADQNQLPVSLKKGLARQLRRAGSSIVGLGPDSLQLNASFLLSVWKELGGDRV